MSERQKGDRPLLVTRRLYRNYYTDPDEGSSTVSGIMSLRSLKLYIPKSISIDLVSSMRPRSVLRKLLSFI